MRRTKTGKFILLILFAFFSVTVSAQLIPQIGEIPAGIDALKKKEFTEASTSLLERKTALKEKAAKLKESCSNVPDDDAKRNAECKAEQSRIVDQKRDLIRDINKLNNLILAETDILLAYAEQEQMDTKFDGWLGNQRLKVELAVKSDTDLTQACMEKLNGFSSPDSSVQRTGLSDLKNGDVLLMYPKNIEGSISDKADKFYNGYSQSENLKASHAIVFIGRDASGRCLFLSNTPRSVLSPNDHYGGPHIIGQTEFEQLYGKTDYFVASPRDPVDGKKLVKAALEMHIQAKERVSLLGSAYGILGNDIVCSEAVDIAIAKATGRQEVKRNKFVDVTPNNFFDPKDEGRYYIISPLVKHK